MFKGPEYTVFNNQETRDKRESICNECPSKDGVRCGECGCFLIFLKKISWTHCPLNKW